MLALLKVFIAPSQVDQSVDDAMRAPLPYSEWVVWSIATSVSKERWPSRAWPLGMRLRGDSEGGVGQCVDM
jgi:hypothetical protein